MADTFLSALKRTLGSAVEEGHGRAVLLPRSVKEIATALDLAQEHEAKIAAPGGPAPEGAVRIDLRHLAEVVAFDDTSRIVHVQAGMTLAALDGELRRRDLTLGVRAAEPELEVGAWLARGAPGAPEVDDDPVSQVLVGLDAVLPDGRELAVRPAPRRAVGPDLMRAMVGARGRLGIIVGAHLATRRRVESRQLAFLFPTRSGADACRAWVRGRGVRPLWTHTAQTAEGSALRLALERGGPLGDAFARLVEQTAKERHGVSVAPEEVAAKPASEGPAPGAIVAALGKRLDPAGVLAPPA